MSVQNKYCSTPSPDWVEFRKKFDAKYFERAATMNSETPLYIQTRYVCLYNDDSQRLDTSFIQSAHDILNDAFNSRNQTEISKIPNNSRYPFKDLVGNPNISFLPLKSTDLTVEYVQINSSSLSNSVPVDDAASRAGRVNGVLNIYIGNTTSQILGQAELGGNIAFCLYTAIGGPNNPGALTNYDLSKTLVHEVGHALNLPHIFSDDSCDHDKLHPDIPEQILPNFNASFIDNGDGTYDGQGDHRYNDRSGGSSSCLHIQSDINSSPNEMFMNYMDYGNDYVSFMFSTAQSLMMREYLTSSSNTTLTLISEDNIDDVTYTTADGADGGISNISDDMDTVSNMNTIVIIVVSIVVFLLIVGFSVYYYKKNHSRKGPKTVNLKAMMNYSSSRME